MRARPKFVEWANPIYPPLPPVPAEDGGAFQPQVGWPCLWPLRPAGDPATLAARSLEKLAQIDHRARRLLDGAGPQPDDPSDWGEADAVWGKPGAVWRP
jgi:hypothetical protein